MTHPLEQVMQKAERFVLIGDSYEGRFPAMSFHCYTKTGKQFYCLDLGGLKTSRGPTKGRKVYSRAAELPSDHGDLAILWVRPRSALRAVEAARQAGCKRVWFNFQTTEPAAVQRAKELGMEIVELGRCPVHYLAHQTPVCRLHTELIRRTGTFQRPPQLEPEARRRELI